MAKARNLASYLSGLSANALSADSGSITSNFGTINTGSSTITTTGAITAGSFVIGSADINENDLEAIDGVTAGTIAASKVVTVDTNKDVSSFRNLTATGTITAANLDISTDVDIDGTLEADAITVDSVALNEYIADTVGAMVSSNTETNVTVTYEDGDNTLDFSVDFSSLQTALTFGISNTNAVKIDSSSVADDEYARFTANGLESRSTSEVLSDIGGQASLTFGISDTNAVKVDSSSVADDEYARFTSSGLESRSTSEVLSDIGGQASLTFGIANTNAVKIDSADVADDEYARFTSNGLESRSTSEVLSDIGAVGTGAVTSITSVLATDVKIGEDDETKIDFEDADQINFYADNTKRVTIDATGLTVNSGSIETATIDYTDGDNAMTIADGGKVTFAAGFDVGSDASGDILYHNGTSYVRLAKGSDSQVLTLASGVPSWAAASGGGGGGGDVVDDTSPQLGGDLDVNGNSIVSASNGNINITPNGTGKVNISAGMYPNLLGTYSTSSLVTQISASGIFSDNYDIYDVVFKDFKPAMSDVRLKMQFFSTSGTLIGGSAYHFYSQWVGTSYSDNRQVDYESDYRESAWVITGKDEFNLSSGTTQGMNGHLRILHTRSDVNVMAHWISAGYESHDSYSVGNEFAIFGSNLGYSVGGLQVYFSNGYIASGSFAVYGIKSGL